MMLRARVEEQEATVCVCVCVCFMTLRLAASLALESCHASVCVCVFVHVLGIGDSSGCEQVGVNTAEPMLLMHRNGVGQRRQRERRAWGILGDAVRVSKCYKSPVLAPEWGLVKAMGKVCMGHR